MEYRPRILMDEAATGGGRTIHVESEGNQDETENNAMTPTTSIIPVDWENRGVASGVVQWKKPIPVESIPKIRGEAGGHIKDVPPGDSAMEGGLIQK